MSEPNSDFRAAIEEATDERVVFNHTVECIVSLLRDELELKKQSKKSNQPSTEAAITHWLENDALDIVQSLLREFEMETHAQLIEGEIAERDREVFNGNGKTVQEAVRQDAELAVRNEAAYRLHDREILPVKTKYAHRYES